MTFILEELEVYYLSEKLSNEVLNVVCEWDSFTKFGMEKQLTNSVNSISANIAEGYGRFFIKENINFCFYARGSLLETKSWLAKTKNRNLINEIKYLHLIGELERIHIKLNAYIRVLRLNLNKQKT